MGEFNVRLYDIMIRHLTVDFSIDYLLLFLVYMCLFVKCIDS